jgi:hypothetical protein
VKNKVIVVASLLAGSFFANADVKVERVMRDPEYTRGNINLLRRTDSIDEASWIWHPELKDEIYAPKPRFLRFRNRFTVGKDKPEVLIDVSADERFHLLCDGEFVACGPNRSTVENWQYQTYALTLDPGEHVLEAVVWKTQDAAPLAQLSWRGGFILKSYGVYDSVLTTGKGNWEVGRITNLVPCGSSNSVWGTGSQFTVTGTGPYDDIPDKWEKPAVVRGPAGKERHKLFFFGLRTKGWMLFPSDMPDQLHRAVSPGTVRAVTGEAGWRKPHVYAESETRNAMVAGFNALLKDGRTLTIPPKTKLQAAWHLGRYICAYPELVVSGGKGARLAWCWTESARSAETKRKGDRSAIVGKYLEGYGDNFVSDGRDRAVFSTPWFRCGLWCRIDIETGDEPLEIRSMKLIETRYPLEMESSFASAQDPSMRDIRRICARAMQMCCHEMLFDCPYYEQQMYPGDTRVQLLVLSALSRDDRMIRRAIELYDKAQRDDGMIPFNWPTRGIQEGATYTLCYLLMYGDYVMHHTNEKWLRARLPGIRKTMAGIEYYENSEGLLENMPGWQFMDWVDGWLKVGTPPGGRYGEGVNAEINLFWSLAMRSAALVERALGNGLQAAYWDEKREKLNRAIVAKFWDEKRGILADTPERKDFSEHAQALALLADALPPEKARTAFRHLVEDEDLKRCTVYFSYYLFEAYFKYSRADLFIKRLDLWRGYVKSGVTTLLESPETAAVEPQSDCHAWGAHPIWFMQTALAGVKSDAPWFRRVLVAPQPGGLKEIKSRHPHPDGWIEVDLRFDGGRVYGKVVTPVPGTFAWGGRKIALSAGGNVIDL